jgi:hypothetical protein
MNTSTVIARSVQAAASALILIAELVVFQLGTAPLG